MTGMNQNDYLIKKMKQKIELLEKQNYLLNEMLNNRNEVIEILKNAIRKMGVIYE